MKQRSLLLLISVFIEVWGNAPDRQAIDYHRFVTSQHRFSPVTQKQKDDAEKILHHEKKHISFSVAMVIHLFWDDMLDEFFSYIEKIIEVFDNVTILITIPEDHATTLIPLIYQHYPQAHIITVENKGADIRPFLKTLQYMRRNHIEVDWILKIHTKRTSLLWRKALIEPIIDPRILAKLLPVFHDPSIGIISSKALHAQFPFYQHHLAPLCRAVLRETAELFPLAYERKRFTMRWYTAGTMFWIRASLLSCFSDDYIASIEHRFTSGKVNLDLNNHKSGYIEHVLELFISGVLPSIGHAKTIIVDDKTHEYALR